MEYKKINKEYIKISDTNKDRMWESYIPYKKYQTPKNIDTLYVVKSGKPKNIATLLDVNINHHLTWRYDNKKILKLNRLFIPDSGKPKNEVIDLDGYLYYTKWDEPSQYLDVYNRYNIPDVGHGNNYTRNIGIYRKWDISKQKHRQPLNRSFIRDAGLLYSGKNYLNINIPLIEWKDSDKSYIPLAWFLKNGKSLSKFKIEDILHLNAPINAGLVTSILKHLSMNFIKERASLIAIRFNKRDVALYSKYLYPYYGDNNTPFIRIMSVSGEHVGLAPAPFRMGLSLFAFKYAEMQLKHTKRNKLIILNKNKLFKDKLYTSTGKYQLYFKYKNLPKNYTSLKILNATRNVRSTFKLWENDTTSLANIEFDALSYQALSYKDSIWDLTKHSYSQLTDPGSVIKFTILDVNNNRLLTTPAFISDFSDEGLEGLWDLILFISAQYPKFTYKGSSKRTISFTFMLGCFDEAFLQQYIDKLNFLRGVGLPSYMRVEISNKRSLLMPRAPIYKLTLGDIVHDTYGYFLKCSLSWLLNFMWNLDRKRLHDMLFKNENIDITRDIHDILIPIYTKIDATFVCMYGRGKSNTDIFYKPYGV